MKYMLWIVLLTISLVLSGCSGLLSLGAQPAATNTPGVPVVTASDVVIAEGNLVPVEWVQLVTRAGGEVDEVLIEEGEQVEAGDVVLRFGDRESREAALSAAELEQMAARQALDELNDTASVATAQTAAAVHAAEKALVDAQQALADLDTRQYSTDLDNARKDVNTFEQDLEDAQKEFDKYKDLDPANNDRKRTDDLRKDAQKKYDDAVRKRDLLINRLDQAKAAVAAAEAQLSEAQRQAEARQNGPDPDQLALAEARLANADAQVKAAERAVRDLDIRAPVAGTVVDLDVLAREVIMPNQPVAVLADFSAWYVETNDLTEMEVVSIREGASAQVIPDALPELRLPASVTRIASQSSTRGGDVTYTVRLRLDADDPALRWGMTVEVRFEDD